MGPNSSSPSLHHHRQSRVRGHKLQADPELGRLGRTVHLAILLMEPVEEELKKGPTRQLLLPTTQTRRPGRNHTTGARVDIGAEANCREAPLVRMGPVGLGRMWANAPEACGRVAPVTLGAF